MIDPDGFRVTARRALGAYGPHFIARAALPLCPTGLGGVELEDGAENDTRRRAAWSVDGGEWLGQRTEPWTLSRKSHDDNSTACVEFVGVWHQRGTASG
jgi:hypothetical protein